MQNLEPLFGLESRKRLARILKTDLAFLTSLAGRDDLYHSFSTVYGGKTRHIERPAPNLERVQKRIHTQLDRGLKPVYLHSGIKGKSYVTNARAHVGPTPTVKLDIRKFYASTSSKRVYKYFSSILQCSPDVSGLLTRLTTHAGHLPIGSHTSQLLAFLVARPLLDEMNTYAEKSGVTFTCYVDDLTFSGTAATPAFLWTIKKIIYKHGYSYHQARYYRAHQKKLITGVVVDANGIHVPPPTRKKIHQAIRSVQASKTAVDISHIRSLVGRIAAASQIDRRMEESLRALRKTGALAQLRSQRALAKPGRA